MKVIMCDNVTDIATIFAIDEKIPDKAVAIEFEGKKHELIPNHGYGMNVLSIKGKHDLNGKKITFITR